MLKRILPLLFLASIAGAGQLQTRSYFKNNGGYVDHISPLLIQENQASDIQNVTMDDRGQLSKRHGYTTVQSTVAFTTAFSTWTVNGGAFHTSTSGSDFFAVVVGTGIYRISSSFSSYSSIAGASVTATTTNLAQAAQLQDKVVFCNEVDKPFYVGASGSAIIISTSTFDAAKTCAAYGTYLVIGNTTESTTAFPSRVRWSDINNINSFPSLNYIDVEPDDGDKIVSLVQFDDSVYVFKKHSIYRMIITGLSGASAFIIRPISRNVGAWAKMSVKAVPNVGIVFLAQNTAYLLNDSGLTPIGDPIQRTFDGLQRSRWPYFVGEVYPKRYQYWLAVSTAGSTSNGTILIYDYIQGNWTKYTGITANMLAQAEDSNGNNILISGDSNASTYIQDNGDVDTPRGVSTAISSYYTTGDIWMDSLDITKGFKYLYITVQGSVYATLNIKMYYDFSTNYENSQDIVVGSSGAQYDTAIYDTAIYPAGVNTIYRIELNRSAKAIKLQFSNTASGVPLGVVGWSIVYSNENFNQ